MIDPESLPDVEIVLPVHNEALSIERTLRELHSELTSRNLKIRFIVCEDGSRDGTDAILRRLAGELPLRLNTGKTRRGYSRAVRDGMAMLEAEYLLCLDSDGQCEPKDFWQFWELRDRHDLLLGWRTERQDTLVRKAASGLFYYLYQALMRTPVHDPSCPFVLVRKPVVQRLIGELGAMQQGFWWEFVARVHRRGYTIRELPVHHRLRLAGVTQVYRWGKMPGIFVRHVIALFRIWKETRR